MNLFWTKGYHATSLKDLEHALSMKPGSIYAAFQSKEALFRATIGRYADRMAGDMERMIDTSPAPLAALQAHLRSLSVLSPCDRPSTACMLVKSLLEVQQDSALRALIVEQLDRIEGLIARALDRAQETSELPATCDTRRVARRIQTYIFGLKVQAQRETDPQQMTELCDDLADELGRLAQG